MDELNQHECMASMTGLIGHMQRNNITPKIEQVSGIEERMFFLYNCHFHYVFSGLSDNYV